VALAVTVLVLCCTLGRAGARDNHTLDVPSHPVRIHYQSGDERVARRVSEICNDRLDELATQLGLPQLPPMDIEIAGDIGSIQRRYGNDLPNWGVAFALMGEGRMVVDVERATRAWNSLEKVIPHELSHLLVFVRARGVPMPVWFLEGLAQWQAREWTLVDNWQLMNAVWSNQAPKLWRLQSSYPSEEESARTAYRVSYAAFAYRFDERFERLPDFLEEVSQRGSFDDAFLSYFNEHPATFYLRFDQHINAKYHSRLLVFQSGPLFSILAALFLLLGIRFYVRKRRKLKEMGDDQAHDGPYADSPGP
jgi:hypothetical protein